MTSGVTDSLSESAPDPGLCGSHFCLPLRDGRGRGLAWVEKLRQEAYNKGDVPLVLVPLVSGHWEGQNASGCCGSGAGRVPRLWGPTQGKGKTGIISSLISIMRHFSN